MIRFSLSGTRVLQGLEGCILHPYHGSADPPGVMTIYTGHVIRAGEHFNNTQAEADAVLLKDLAWVQAWIWRNCPWSTNEGDAPRQHNFDALCCLVFNSGHVFDDVLAVVNGSNDPAALKVAWMRHTKANGKDGVLTFRRAKEVALYLTPDVPADTIDRAAVLASVYATSSQIVADFAMGSPVDGGAPPNDV